MILLLGEVVRHGPFVVGIHLGRLTSKVVPIKTKIWKQGTTKKDFRQVQGSCCFPDTFVGILIIRVTLKPLQFNTNIKHKNMLKYMRFTCRIWLIVLYLYWLAFMLFDWRQGQSTPRYLLQPLSPSTNHLANYFLHLDEYQQRFIVIMCSSSLHMFFC